jgi:AmmeMemoRadiSam system protein A
MIELVNQQNQKFLLTLARQALETYVRSGKTIHPDTGQLNDEVVRQGATFVTLHKHHQLRGCIGTLLAYQTIYEDVIEHAIAAGTQDYRFPRVQENELADLHYEISILSNPSPITYSSPEDLLNQLRIGIDGVVISSGFQRATFLPQVWDSLPDKEEFMNQLCRKMGVRANAWRNSKYDISLYQVQEFAE